MATQFIYSSPDVRTIGQECLVALVDLLYFGIRMMVTGSQKSIGFGNYIHDELHHSKRTAGLILHYHNNRTVPVPILLAAFEAARKLEFLFVPCFR